jgi:NADH-quinone oxidoreductase subunit J
MTTRRNSVRFASWAFLTLLVLALVGFMGWRVIGPLQVQADARLGLVTLGDLVFYVLAALTLAGAAGVAFSRNVLHSAIGLLMALLGVGALYVLLSADFLAVTQLLVYIGGVLVLVLFAVMLTNRIGEVNVSNRSVGLAGGVGLFLAAAPILLFVAVRAPWPLAPARPMFPTTELIGDAFLSRWLLPFELASLLLLATLIGAVVIARKETSAE